MPEIERISDLPAPPVRPNDAHKGTFGRVLVVGGCRGMSGAVCLAGLGALRGGAGLVFLAVPEPILDIVASVEPSYLTIPLPCDAAGCLAHASVLRTLKMADEYSAVAVGPGLGPFDAGSDIVRRLYTEAHVPLVLDADGLNALSQMRDLLDRIPETDGRRAVRVLTPHPGEFGRLIDRSAAEVQKDRENLATAFARENGVIVVLKGHRTLVTDGRCLYENHTGNHGMATGGTGDVLTGLMAALLAQGMPAFDAARLAVWLHGTAGDIAAEELSHPALIASDLPRYLPHAWKRLASTV
ncbi:MAG: NAD(P)H-hydrate dehydratase [Planctomycetes bacterium]|nr:NAD(P)H-hydrate dehydratase [Planctomycetota bacterium]